MGRVRDQLRRDGAQTLSTAELLALILFPGRKKDAFQQAHTLLENYGIRGLRTIAFDGLCADVELSPAQVERLHVICELTQRFAKGDPGERVRIVSAFDAVRLVRPMLAHLDHEEFRVLVLDERNHVVANTLLYMGTVNETSLRASEVFRQAIVRNCPKVLLAHNHPSDDTTPSPEDIETTKHLVGAALLLNIDLLDHIIIGSATYVSMRERIGWE